MDQETRTGTTHNRETVNATDGNTDNVVTEEYTLSGESVVAKVREIVREGNVRRITLKNDEGRTLLEIPLTVGVVGAVLLPVWAAIGAVAALVANLTLSVERKGGQDIQKVDGHRVENVTS